VNRNLLRHTPETISLSVYQIPSSDGKKQAFIGSTRRLDSTKDVFPVGLPRAFAGLTFPFGLSSTQWLLSFTQTTLFSMDIANRRVCNNTPRSLPDESA
jgi:hypothetical protein